jgi:dethiobiotin synthetase
MPRMRGVTVVGCGLDSGEAIVAAGACAAARAAGEDARLFVTALLGPSAEPDAALVGAVSGTQPASVFRTAAAPLIAAKHAGAHLDPATLIEEARSAADGGLLVAAAPGGFLAPLTEHYSVRDFARELGLPVVIAARAAGGVTSQVRLVGEAARAAGVAVAAVVLTGWPDPPNRVQLDERELLAKAARVQVLTLAEEARSGYAVSEAASGWPVAEWAETAAVAPAGGAPSAGPGGPPAAPAAPAIVLDPYDAWRPRQLGDPRNTPRPQIMQAMLEIIEAEGPMTATRAYSLYNRAAGGRKLTSVAKAPLSSAVYWLARESRLTLTREADIPWQGDDMVRLNDQPAVRVRELGTRSLDDVPLDEIAELVKLLRAARGSDDPTEVKRAILSTYGLVRLTGRADEYLGLAIDLAS